MKLIYLIVGLFMAQLSFAGQASYQVTSRVDLSDGSKTSILLVKYKKDMVRKLVKISIATNKVMDDSEVMNQVDSTINGKALFKVKRSKPLTKKETVYIKKMIGPIDFTFKRTIVKTGK